MIFDSLKAYLRGGLTGRRIARAILRRIRAFPHNVAYELGAGPGSENYSRLAQFENAHRGERSFVLGNGPSLARTDLSRIQREHAIGVNHIFLIFDQVPFRPTYYVSMNELILRQSAERISQLQMPRFLNWGYRHLFGGLEGVAFLRESYRPHFSLDIKQGIWGGATVTFAALQIAYFMGFEEVVLIGVDHHYQATGTPHTEVVSKGSDPNHFHPSYFPAGFRWHLPDLAISEYAYRLADQAFQSAGRRILDATIGGRLEVFPKVAYDQIVRS